MKSELSTFIKNQAIEIGFSKVGIAKATSSNKQKENLETWLENGKHAEMHWIDKRKEERVNIKNYYPNAKSIISLAMNYNTGKKQEEIKSGFKFSNYAWGDDYHLVIKNKLRDLLLEIKKFDSKVDGIACVDTSPIMEKYWAQESGLGWQGKNTNLISRDYGSWLFLGELILDIELEYDPPFNDDLCGSCVACIESCPTQALSEYQIDARKCISYWSIEHKGDFDNSSNIKLHDWIYGCDICQEVCPWNIKFGKITSEACFYPRKEIFEWTKEEWNALDQESFSCLFKKSSVKRAKYSGVSRNIKHNLIEKGDSK